MNLNLCGFRTRQEYQRGAAGAGGAHVRKGLASPFLPYGSRERPHKQRRLSCSWLTEAGAGVQRVALAGQPTGPTCRLLAPSDSWHLQSASRAAQSATHAVAATSACIAAALVLRLLRGALARVTPTVWQQNNGSGPGLTHMARSDAAPGFCNLQHARARCSWLRTCGTPSCGRLPRAGRSASMNRMVSAWPRFSRLHPHAGFYTGCSTHSLRRLPAPAATSQCPRAKGCQGETHHDSYTP
jgi:hypothetical protein